MAWSVVRYHKTTRRDLRTYITLEEGSSLAKIPTLVSYDKSDASKFSWGAEAVSATGKIAAIKLFLDPSQPRPKYLPDIDLESESRKLLKPAVEIAADFIRAIHQHAILEIEKALSTEHVASCLKDYVMTGTIYPNPCIYLVIYSPYLPLISAGCLVRRG